VQKAKIIDMLLTIEKKLMMCARRAWTLEVKGSWELFFYGELKG